MHLFAYLDPGTGSLIVQTLIGGALAGIVVLRGFIANATHKVKRLFSRQQKQPATDEEA
jgi:hypothetical protein